MCFTWSVIFNVVADTLADLEKPLECELGIYATSTYDGDVKHR